MTLYSKNDKKDFLVNKKVGSVHVYEVKELLEKIDELKDDISELKADMEATRILIRDYNNLRQKVEETTTKLNTIMWLIPVMIAGMGLLFTFINFITAR